VAEVQRLAIEAFRAIDACGMSRVDFLLSRATGALLAERDQHHPGLHHHQHVREAVGGERRALPALVDRLIQLARSSGTQDKQRLRTSAV
jgi:D-alanine-D-alanine ligase